MHEPSNQNNSGLDPSFSTTDSENQELDESLIKRVFQIFAFLALAIVVLTLVLIFYPDDDVGELLASPQASDSDYDDLSVKAQRLQKFPRLSYPTNFRVMPLSPELSSDNGIEQTETMTFSGGLSLVQTTASRPEIVSISHWPEGRLRRWILEDNALKEMRLAIQNGGKLTGWISVAAIDVNADGVEDLLTGGLGVIGCWLRDLETLSLIWQPDSCGLIVDGDSWVSSIEIMDVNQDGRSDVWLNLMTRRESRWLGKPNHLWIFDTDGFVDGTMFLNSEIPSRASYASSLYDLDADGVSELIVANLDAPIEIWRQIPGQPLVESREFFGVESDPSTHGRILTGTIFGNPNLSYFSGTQLKSYSFAQHAKGVPVSNFVLNGQWLARYADHWTWWDYDLDGQQDLLVGRYSCEPDPPNEGCSARVLLRAEPQSGALFHHYSSLKFQDVESFGTTLRWDLDHDGDEDFLVMRSDGELEVHENTSNLGNHWLGLSFGPRWQGARLEVHRSDGEVYREVLQSSNGGGMNQGLWRRFGLSDGRFISRIALTHPLFDKIDRVGAQPLDSWLRFE